MTTNRIRYDAGAPHAPAVADTWAGGISDDVDDLVEPGVRVWWFDAGADADAARPAAALATDIVVWTNTPSVPTNLGDRDQWEDAS